MPMHENPYVRLGIMAVLSFISMYALMYAMVDRLENVYPNLNQFYMSGIMTAPMVIIEILLLRGMYHNDRINIAIIATSLVALTMFWVLIRQQTAIGDNQFLRSMIPHHAGAILMCEDAAIEDADIKKLCGNIIQSQQAEIAQMKTLLGSRARR